MKIVIYGAGKQAELTHYLFAHDSPCEVVAFCVAARYLPADGAPKRLLGLPVVPFEEVAALYPPRDYALHVAMGENSARTEAFRAAKALGYRCANYISSRAQTWPDLVVGENVFIDQASRMHPFVQLGDNGIYIGADIGHHSVVGSHVLLSVTVLAGSVVVGDGSVLGMGSMVREGVRIGAHNLIGAGALIEADTEPYAVYTSNLSSRRRAVDARRVKLFKR